MPSREEIVEWLREAEAVLKDYETILEGTGRRTAAHDIQCLHEDFAERAAQVSAMRCETCEHYDKQHQLCEVVGGSELLIPGYFGCFSHELKEEV